MAERPSTASGDRMSTSEMAIVGAFAVQFYQCLRNRCQNSSPK
jgi:hypothetical protein